MVNALCLVIGGAEECTKHPEKSYNEHCFKAEAALFASGIEDGFVQDSDSAVKDYIPPFMVSFSSKESDNVQIL